MFFLFPGYISINRAQPLPPLLIGVMCITFLSLEKTVYSAMISLRWQNHPVVRVVIPTITINVVDYFTFFRRSSELPLSNHSVLMPPEILAAGSPFAVIAKLLAAFKP